MDSNSLDILAFLMVVSSQSADTVKHLEPLCSIPCVPFFFVEYSLFHVFPVLQSQSLHQFHLRRLQSSPRFVPVYRTTNQSHYTVLFVGSLSSPSLSQPDALRSFSQHRGEKSLVATCPPFGERAGKNTVDCFTPGTRPAAAHPAEYFTPQ